MKEIHTNLYIGNQNNYEYDVKLQSNWAVVHACKEPYHRDLLNYTGRRLSTSDPEYLVARRGDRLYLNLIDADSSLYISKKTIDSALEFIEEALSKDKKCLVHCNMGQSRSPSIGLLYLAMKKILPEDFQQAEKEFKKIYPNYNPKGGIRRFVMKNWSTYVKGEDND